MAVTPMFPLGTVLLPGTAVPLHVFEPRYVTMVRDLLAADDSTPQFGVVMIERGFEVGGGDMRAGVGTLAAATGIQATPDGGYALLAVGTARIRVDRWLPDDPYPRAETAIWPDESPVPGDADQTIRMVASSSARLVELAEAVGVMGAEAPDVEQLSDDPRLALYQIAGSAPIGPADRFRILAAPDFLQCVDAVVAAFDDASAVLEFRRS